MRDGSIDEKLHLYGTHDINIINTLRAMGFVDELFKLDFGVSLVFELHVIDGGQSQEVRVSFDEKLKLMLVLKSTINFLILHRYQC